MSKEPFVRGEHKNIGDININPKGSKTTAAAFMMSQQAKVEYNNELLQSLIEQFGEAEGLTRFEEMKAQAQRINDLYDEIDFSENETGHSFRL